MDMSQQSEERNRQKFAEKMRKKSQAVINAKLGVKKAAETKTPAAGAESKAQE
jgi:hypothetical protein